METGAFFHIVHSELLSLLIARNAHMLCCVVLKDTVHVLEERDDPNIEQEDGKADNPIDKIECEGSFDDILV